MNTCVQVRHLVIHQQTLSKGCRYKVSTDTSVKRTCLHPSVTTPNTTSYDLMLIISVQLVLCFKEATIDIFSNISGQLQKTSAIFKSSRFCEDALFVPGDGKLGDKGSFENQEYKSHKL